MVYAIVAKSTQGGDLLLIDIANIGAAAPRARVFDPERKVLYPWGNIQQILKQEPWEQVATTKIEQQPDWHVVTERQPGADDPYTNLGQLAEAHRTGGHEALESAHKAIFKE